VGEGPGQEEDLSGRPFVGPAGQYLDKWLSSVGLSRKTNCYIANTVKCRPPGNRDPVPEETQACLPYLNRQLDLLKPRFILALGRVSGQLLSGENVSLSRLRGRLLSYRGFPLLVTYHPSGVLRNPDEYRPLVWEDLKRLRDLLRSAPEAGKTGEGGE
jgi:DNA polymerase